MEVGSRSEREDVNLEQDKSEKPNQRNLTTVEGYERLTTVNPSLIGIIDVLRDIIQRESKIWDDFVHLKREEFLIKDCTTGYLGSGN